MSYKLTLHFQAGDKEYTVLREGFSINERVGDKGRHSTQSASVSIRSREAALLILMEKAKLIGAELKNGTTVIFEGVVRPYQTLTAKGCTEGNMSLEILDYSEKMHRTIGGDSGVSLYDTNLKDIIEELYDLSGISSTLRIPEALEDVDLPYFSAGPDKYIDTILSEVLYEYGYDFIFSPGYCDIISTSSDLQNLQSISDIRNTLSVTRDDNWSDGIEVSYGKAAFLSQAKIGYCYTRMPGNGILLPYLAQNVTGTYPETKRLYWDLKMADSTLTDAQILYVSNIKVDLYHKYDNGAVTYTIGDPDTSGVDFEISYDVKQKYVWGESITPNVIEATVYADVVYKIENQETVGEVGDNPTKLSATYIFNEEDARALATLAQWRATSAPLKYSFQSLSRYQVGSFYTLVENVTGISTKVRVVSCSYEEDGLYLIRCEGADDVDDIDIKLLQIRDRVETAGESLTLAATSTQLYVGDSTGITASGYLTTSEDITLRWRLNDEEITVSGLSVELTDTELDAGRNRIDIEALYGSEIVAATFIYIERVATAADGFEIEYAIGTDPNVPPNTVMMWGANEMMWGTNEMVWGGGIWTKEAPVPSRGQYLWMRTRSAT